MLIWGSWLAANIPAVFEIDGISNFMQLLKPNEGSLLMIRIRALLRRLDARTPIVTICSLKFAWPHQRESW